MLSRIHLEALYPIWNIGDKSLAELFAESAGNLAAPPLKEATAG